MKRLLFLILISLLWSACNLSDDDIARSLIAGILRDIEFQFNQQNPDQSVKKIMEYYHPDYKHNSEGGLVSVENFWSKYIIDYSSMKIENVDIDFYNDDRAIAQFKITFFDKDNKPSILYKAPEPFGILSYYKHD